MNIVELDPDDTSVGYGGLPNADGVVQLDSSVMHGPKRIGAAVKPTRKRKNACSAGVDKAFVKPVPPMLSVTVPRDIVRTLSKISFNSF